MITRMTTTLANGALASARRALLPLALSACLGGAFAATANAADDPHPTVEYQVKASLIFNFAQFVDWPAGAEAQDTANFHLCIVGRDQFGPALTTLEREIIHGKRLKIDRFPSLGELQLGGCQVLFVALSSDDEIRQALQASKGLQVLTIGESSNFVQQGGIIGLAVQDNKIVFDINRDAALDARLEISAKLLRIARKVDGTR